MNANDDMREAVARAIHGAASQHRGFVYRDYEPEADAAIAVATPLIRSTLFDELIAAAIGDNWCALELSHDTGSFGGGSEYVGTLKDWLRTRKEQS